MLLHQGCHIRVVLEQRRKKLRLLGFLSHSVTAHGSGGGSNSDVTGCVVLLDCSKTAFSDVTPP